MEPPFMKSCIRHCIAWAWVPMTIIIHVDWSASTKMGVYVSTLVRWWGKTRYHEPHQRLKNLVTVLHHFILLLICLLVMVTTATLISSFKMATVLSSMFWQQESETLGVKGEGEQTYGNTNSESLTVLTLIHYGCQQSWKIFVVLKLQLKNLAVSIHYSMFQGFSELKQH